MDRDRIDIEKVFYTSAGDGYAIVRFRGALYHLACVDCDPQAKALALQPEDFDGR